MTYRQYGILVWLTASCAVVVTGCGGSSSTVTGRVCSNGHPVTSGSVILYCADKQIVHGIIEPDGRYSIPNVPRGVAVVTVRAHTRTPAGMQVPQNLPPVINGPKSPSDTSVEPRVAPIPLRYALPEESGLSLVVNRDQMQYEIDLKP